MTKIFLIVAGICGVYFGTPITENASDSKLLEKITICGSYTYTWFSRKCDYDVYVCDVTSKRGASHLNCHDFEYYGEITPGSSVTYKVRLGQEVWVKIKHSGADPCLSNGTVFTAQCYVRENSTSNGGERREIHNFSCGS